MTTPLSDEQLAELRAKRTYRHDRNLFYSTLDHDEIGLLFDEVDRLRARVTTLEGVLRDVDDALAANKDICPICHAFPPIVGARHEDDCALVVALEEMDADR